MSDHSGSSPRAAQPPMDRVNVPLPSEWKLPQSRQRTSVTPCRTRSDLVRQRPTKKQLLGYAPYRGSWRPGKWVNCCARFVPPREPESLSRRFCVSRRLIVVTAAAIFAGTPIQSTNGYYHNDRASTERSRGIEASALWVEALPYSAGARVPRDDPREPRKRGRLNAPGPLTK